MKRIWASKMHKLYKRHILGGIIIWLVCNLLLACHDMRFESAEELSAFVYNENNHYTQHKIINGVRFDLTYKPTDLMVSQQIGDTGSDTRIGQLRKQYGNHLYFTLKMSKNDQELLTSAVSNRVEFGEMVHQLSFEMQEKVQLTTSSKEAIAMTDFIYPRMYGLSKATSILFVFPRDSRVLEADYLNFTIADLGLMTGEVRFKLETAKLMKEPRLF